MFRDFRNGQVVLSDSFLVHPELFPKPLPGAADPNNCRLATWRLVNGSSIAPGSEPATDSRLTRPEVSKLRAILVLCGRGTACSSRRHRALLGHHGGRSCRAVFAHHAPHGSVLISSTTQGTSATSPRRTGSGCSRSSSRCTTASRTRQSGEGSSATGSCSRLPFFVGLADLEAKPSALKLDDDWHSFSSTRSLSSECSEASDGDCPIECYQYEPDSETRLA